MKSIWLLASVVLVVCLMFLSVHFVRNGWGKTNFGNESDSGIGKSNNFTEELSILFGGDLMFDRNIRYRGERDGYSTLLSGAKEIMSSADIAVVNLEGPITANPSKTLLPDGTYTRDFTFTFATSSVIAISGVGIDVVSLANNHTDNFGYAGFVETKKWLDSVSVKYFGSYWNASSTEFVFEKDGIKIALVGYHAFQSGLERVLSDVERLSQEGYFVIVMPHWGEEYIKVHSPKMESIALQFIARGAKAIVGAHPHVVMDRQWFGSVPVFYSLGNFLFDQYFSADVMKGNLLKITVSKSGLGNRLKSVEIFDVHNSKDKPIWVTKDAIKIEMP